jgi:ATP-dependent DNA helicase PIF1
MADDAMIIPKGYVQAKRLVECDHRLVFVSGNAGTGKTTLIRYLQNNVALRNVVLAPTGVAALNAGGVTIHSFFRFPPRIQDPEQIRIPEDHRLHQKLQLLIIDEVSMLRADVLDNIDVFLRVCNNDLSPFGGVRVLLLGDMFQLPPVVPAAEWELLEARGYDSPYFFSASCLEGMDIAHVELEEIFRQKDGEFISLLNRIRVAEDVDVVVDRLNSWCGEPDGEPTGDHDITLTCTNRAADAVNAEELAKLPAEERVFLGEVEGKFGLEGDRLPSPGELRLKQGARVMFTKNDEEGCWVNGTLGTVTWLSGDRIEVDVDGAGIHEVPRATWQSFKYRFDGKSDRIVADEVGHYTQYPLMLAWAVTIHKSQGKTLGRVLIDFGSGAFAPGQAYVALSRCLVGNRAAGCAIANSQRARCGLPMSVERAALGPVADGLVEEWARARGEEAQGGYPIGPDLADQIQVARGKGSPLPGTFRAAYEGRFGQLSPDVQVHDVAVGVTGVARGSTAPRLWLARSVVVCLLKGCASRTSGVVHCRIRESGVLT